MSTYKLSPRALKDVAEIVAHLHIDVSPSVAETIEARFFAAFHALAVFSSLGHKRTDITRRKVLFHGVKPYVVIFRRTSQSVFVLRVAHASRDLQKML